MVVWIFVLGDDMFRVILLGFLVFTVSSVVVSTNTYAISLDDDEEDAEDVADLLDEAKKAGKTESFDKADELLKKAKMYGVKTEDTKEVISYVAEKKQEKEARLERERKEKERLARLKREKEERERLAKIERESTYASSSSSHYSSSSNELKTYNCSYQCRTSGFILYDHSEFTMTVQANESYQAESKVEDYADDKCNTMKGASTGLRMWDSSIRCEQRY